MKRFKRVFLTTLIASCVALNVGCSFSFNEGQVNIDDPATDLNDVPDYDDNNVDAQVKRAQNEQSEKEKIEYKDLTDNELNQLNEKILNFHNKTPTTSLVEAVNRYEELQDDMNQYAYSVINRPNCEELITKMQKDLERSRFKRHDNDKDGISDYYEMMVSNTSPLADKSLGDKLDSQERYNIAFICYLSKDGKPYVIQPEFSKMFYEAIFNGNIKPLNNQYMVLNLRAYGGELDSLRFIIEDKDNKSISDLINKTKSGIVYPISFRIKGSISKQLSGTLDIEHMDYSTATNQESLILQTSDDILSTGHFIDYLARTPTSTSLPPDDSITADKTYTLIFPYERDFEGRWKAFCYELYTKQHPEVLEKDK